MRFLRGFWICRLKTKQMSLPKIVFSLTLLGVTRPGVGVRAWIHFQIHDMDLRFIGNRGWTANNGWEIRSTGYPEVDFPSRVIYLWGTNPYTRMNPCIKALAATDEAEAMERLSGVIAALEDWAAHCPAVEGLDVRSGISPEVAASLMNAVDIDPPYEGDEGRAPIFVDLFTPNNIRL